VAGGKSTRSGEPKGRQEKKKIECGEKSNQEKSAVHIKDFMRTANLG